MPTLYDDREITSLADLLGHITEDLNNVTGGLSEGGLNGHLGIWFRGLSFHGHSLLPTLHRRGQPLHSESYLLNRFKQNAHQFLDYRPQGEWEWMLLARHHGLPSRLLDWSENPLIGLYFATGEDANNPDSNGALWCLSPGELNILASNGTIPSDELPMFLDESELTQTDEFLMNYRASRLPPAPNADAVAPAAAASIRIHSRIRAQQGVFTIHHIDKTPLEDWSPGRHIWRYIVPSELKARIRNELRLFGITPLSVFPSLDHVASEASRGY